MRWATAAELRAMVSGDGSAAATAWYYVVNSNSRLVLGVRGSSDANGAAVIQWDKNPGRRSRRGRSPWTVMVASFCGTDATPTRT
jgi:hypothetical protein